MFKKTHYQLWLDSCTVPVKLPLTDSPSVAARHGRLLVAATCPASTEEERRAAFTTFEKRLAAQGIAMDRILGLEDGTIAPLEPEVARQLYGFTVIGPQSTRDRAVGNSA